MERITGVAKMQTLALLAVDKEKLSPFFSRVPELFEKHHHDSSQNSDQYEELLYKVHRPYTKEMLHLIDDWMGHERIKIGGEQEIMLRLFLLAIRYPDTLLFDSLDEVLVNDIRRLSAYLHFVLTEVWQTRTRQGRPHPARSQNLLIPEPLWSQQS